MWTGRPECFFPIRPFTATKERQQKSQTIQVSRGILERCAQFFPGGSTMRRFVSTLVVIVFLSLTGAAVAEDATSGATATCNFDGDKQLAAGYQHVAVNLK